MIEPEVTAGMQRIGGQANGAAADQPGGDRLSQVEQDRLFDKQPVRQRAGHDG
jgi:hypothetical protein